MIRSYQEEQAYISARVQDLFSVAFRRQYAVYSPFWNEQQIALAQREIDCNRFENYRFFGGYSTSERKILGVFPFYVEPDEAVFPISALSFSIPKGYQLSHRDVLGALTALNIARDHIGDILISSQCGAFYLKQSVVPLVKQELHRIGSVGITLEKGVDLELFSQKKFHEIQGTVASLRLDAVVALIVRASREKALEMVRSGVVSLNHFPALVPNTNVHPGDLITIRGYGKFLFKDTVRPTRKGRLFLTILQFI